MSQIIDLGRRRLLVTGAGVAAVTTLGARVPAVAAQEGATASTAKPLPAYVSWKDAPSLYSGAN